MATQEEILGDIRQLNTEIGALETKQQLATTEGLKISYGSQITAIRNQITAKTVLLTALITSQRGNLSSRIYIVISQSSRCNHLPKSFRHLLFTHPGSAAAQGKR